LRAQRAASTYGLLNSVEDENAAVPGGADRRRVHELDGAGDQLLPLLEVALRRVAGQAHVLVMPLCRIAVEERDAPARRTRWADEEHVTVCVCRVQGF
jgi:hypothetical protein